LLHKKEDYHLYLSATVLQSQPSKDSKPLPTTFSGRTKHQQLEHGTSLVVIKKTLWKAAAAVALPAGTRRAPFFF